MELPPFNAEGDLPPGIYRVKLSEALGRFGGGTAQRQAVAARLVRIHQLASSTGYLVRFVVFGSFVTATPKPRDVDVVLVMDDGFDLATVSAEVAVVFNHSEADSQLGASIYWVRRASALGGEQSLVEYWQTKRGGGQRDHRNCGGGNVIANDTELKTTLERITWLQQQVINLRATETNPVNYHAASGGFLTEIDRMQREVREYLSFHPAELAGAA